MRLLLDSHAFLWAVSGDPRLSPRAARAMAGRDREAWLSHVSVWELTAKASSGRLAFPEPVAVMAGNFGAKLLPITPRHIEATAELPPHHRDPFDRLLVAQAIEEGLTLVTADERIQR